jgi:hypothetical protein
MFDWISLIIPAPEAKVDVEEQLKSETKK